MKTVACETGWTTKDHYLILVLICGSCGRQSLHDGEYLAKRTGTQKYTCWHCSQKIAVKLSIDAWMDVEDKGD